MNTGRLLTLFISLCHLTVFGYPYTPSELEDAHSRFLKVNPELGDILTLPESKKRMAFVNYSFQNGEGFQSLSLVGAREESATSEPFHLVMSLTIPQRANPPKKEPLYMNFHDVIEVLNPQRRLEKNTSCMTNDPQVGMRLLFLPGRNDWIGLDEQVGFSTPQSLDLLEMKSFQFSDLLKAFFCHATEPGTIWLTQKQERWQVTNANVMIKNADVPVAWMTHLVSPLGMDPWPEDLSSLKSWLRNPMSSAYWHTVTMSQKLSLEALETQEVVYVLICLLPPSLSSRSVHLTTTLTLEKAPTTHHTIP